jgi:hypothetical protein
MFDRRAAKETFRAALAGISRGNPHSLAKVIQVPNVAAVKSDATGSIKPNPEVLKSENGTDWSGILNSWLDACEASARVRNQHSLPLATNGQGRHASRVLAVSYLLYPSRVPLVGQRRELL